MKQQTSVEWLVDEIEKHYITNIGTLDPTIVMELRRQAKEMEKEQIVKAVYDSMGNNFDPNMGRAEMYYKENYGGNK
jgi:hypothetical protein